MSKIPNKLKSGFGFLKSKARFYICSIKEKLLQKEKELLPEIKTKYSKFPSFSQWKEFPAILTLKEKIIFCILYVSFLISLGLILQNFWLQSTQLLPKEGGKYSEALIGQPRFINPLLAPFNDIDRDISQLVFSGLMKYDSEGKIICDLAEKFEIKDDGKTYEFVLKKGIKWHDGVEFTADDVIFTIKILQDPAYTSPLRINWQGVKIEKVDDFSVRFILTNPYAPFIENLTLGILPKHLWEKIHPKNFPLADLNIKKPIGTGPYKFKNFKKDEFGFIKSYTLEANPYFYAKKPYLKEITFLFFSDIQEGLSAFNKNLVQGVGFISPPTFDRLKRESNQYLLWLPRYFSIFFNTTQSEILSEKNIRKALSLGINKKEIVEKIWSGQAKIISSPILPEIFGFNLPQKTSNFDKALAEKILEESNWKDRDGDGFREKIIEKTKKIGKKEIKEEEKIPLELTLTTLNSQELELLATLIKEHWQKLGVKVNLEILGNYEIQQDKIKPRQYEAILFGEILGMIPDPFSFWHSSQKKDPGLNLSLFGSRDADRLLEEARQNLDEKVRAQKYEKFQEIVLKNYPAIFLYSPPYFYIVDKNIKGIEAKKIADPSKRFVGIENWYIKTKRVWE